MRGQRAQKRMNAINGVITENRNEGREGRGGQEHVRDETCWLRCLAKSTDITPLDEKGNNNIAFQVKHNRLKADSPLSSGGLGAISAVSQ